MKFWKLITFIPLILLAISVVFLFSNYMRTGEFIQRDIEFIGGKTITFQYSSIQNLQKIKSSLQDSTVKITPNFIIVESSVNANETYIIDIVTANAQVNGQPTIETIGPVLGAVFWQQAQMAIVVAFILMSIVVFILFRTFVPSMAVILSALTDIVVTVMIIDLLGFKLSLATLAGLLMLIGYSVDTDILLTTRLMKSHISEIPKRIKSAMKTGLMTQGTTIAAAITLYIVIDNAVVQQIAAVIMIGILIDILSTWLCNAGILRMYMERKERMK